MKNDIVDRLLAAGFVEAPNVNWPVIYFDGGGGVGDTGDTGGTGTGSTGDTGTGNTGASDTGNTGNSLGDLGGLGLADTGNTGTSDTGNTGNTSGTSETGGLTAADGVGQSGSGTGNIGDLGFGTTGTDTGETGGFDLGDFAGVEAAIALAASNVTASMSDAEAEAALAQFSNIANALNSVQGMTATNGMSKGELTALQSMGLGATDISDTQTVDQALAAMNVHGYLSDNIGAVVGALGGPALGAIATAANAMAQGHSFASVIGHMAASVVGTALSQATGLNISGATVSALANGQIGQAAMGLAIGQVAQSTGLSVGAVTSALSGNFGAAVANTVTGAVVGAAANSMGAGPLGGLALGALATQSGAPASLASSINQSEVGQAINSVTASLNDSISSSGLGSPGGVSGISGAVSNAQSDGGAGTQVDVFLDSVTGGTIFDARNPVINTGSTSGSSPKPSKPNKYWENLYSDLGVQFKNPPAQNQQTTEADVVAAQTKADSLIKAAQDYEDIFGDLTPEAASVISSAPDPVRFVDSLYTSEDEAKEIWKEKFGTEPTEFDLLEIIGLSEGNASDKVGDVKADRETFTTSELKDVYKAKYGEEPTESWMNSDEAKAMLMKTDASGRLALDDYYVEDKKTTTLDEAEKIWEQMGNTRPMTTDELATIAGGHEGSAELISKHAFNLDMTIYNGRDYETVEEAAEGARKAGMTQFFGPDGQIYVANPSPIAEANARANIEEKKTFNEAFAAARKELGAGKTFTWNGKQYTTNMLPNDTFDASKSSTVTTAATLAYANGKDKFIGPDGKTYTLDAQAKSVLDNSVNQSAAETQRLLNLKPTTDETPAETQRLMESGTRGTMDAISAKTAQALGATQRGFGQFLSNAGKSYAAITGDLDFDNAVIKLGNEIETYAKGNDIYGLDVQKNRMSQALALANETDNWIEKIKIIGPAIGKNSIGFFDIAFSEAVEDVPETILQIGAALMTGGTTLAAQGAIAVIGVAGSVMETFGSTVEETFKKSLKAGDDKSVAMNKAYLNGVLSTAIEAGTNYVADKAMLAPFLNKFTGTLAGTATGFVSSTTIGAASELAAGFSQSYATQYIVNPATASLSKAATDGIFEMFIGGTAQGGTSLPGYAIQGGAIIGKDYFGKDLTMADVASGAILNSSTVNPNATVATSDDGDPITLGGAMLQMPNYQFDMSALKTYVPQVFNNDSLIVGQDELGNNVTFGDLMGETTPTKDFDAVYKSLLDITPEQRTEAKYDFVADLFSGLDYKPTNQDINALIAQNPTVTQLNATDVKQYADAKTITETEAKKFFEDAGYKPTAEEVKQFVQSGASVSDSSAKAQVENYVAPRQVTTAEAEKFFTDLGYKPTAAEINQFVNSGVSVSEATTKENVSKYVAPLQVTEADARKFFADLGYTPTEAEVKQFVKQAADVDVASQVAGYVNPRQVTRAEAQKFFSDLGYRPSEAEIASYIKQGDANTQATITSAINTYVDPKVVSEQEVRDAFAAIGLNDPTESDVKKLVGQYSETELANKAAQNLNTARFNALNAEIENTETAILKELDKNEKAGMQRDTALQKAIEKVADNQKTDASKLLTKLGTTESALNTKIGAVQRELAQTEKDILAEVEANEKAGVKRDEALEKALNTVATNQGKDVATLTKKISALGTNLGKEIDVVQKNIDDTETAILAEVAKNEKAGMARDVALGKAVAKVASDQNKDTATLTKSISTLGKTLGKEIDAVQKDIDDTETAILAEVAKNEKAGMSRDAALTKSINTVAAAQKKDSAALLAKLGKTETALNTKIGTLQTELAQTERDILAEVEKNEQAGMNRDAALTTAINKVAATQKKDVTALTKSIGALGTTFGKEIDTLQADLAQTERDILAEVARNEKAGMSRDAALQKAINTVAATQKKDSAALLAKLGKTEATLGTKISTLETELAQTERDILAEVARNEAAGMDRDAALQKAINTVAATQKKDVSTITKDISALGASLGKEIDTLQADLDQTERDILAQVALNEKAGMTRDAALQKAINTVAATQQKDSAALLTKLGKTEAALKSEFETKLSGISTEISDTRRTLEEAIQAAKDIGLKGDAALQAGLDSVASNLNITKEALLTQLGTTETALRSEFAAGISDIQTQMQEQYTTLTAGQKTIADNLVAQGKTLEEAIATAKQETAGQIETLTADVQAKYDALTAEQKALANAMNQSGLDLKAAINLAAQQTQAQITGLGQQVDTRINELMQQGQTQQQATQQAISELNTQNQQLQALVGTQGRVATQTDIDVMTQMLGGQRDIDLTYDITGDKKITQDDIDLLTQVVEGSNTDWKAPAGSVFAPTGLYGQLAINEAQRQAEMSAWREREEAEAAEAQRQGKISNVRGTAAKGKQDIDSFAQQLPQAFQQAQQTTTPLYGTMEYFDPFSNPFGDPFGTQKMKIASSTNPADATKIAAGGYIDDLLAEDMSVDDLMNLLR